MEPNFCMENGLKTMETMDSMINIGGYGIWEWGINLNVEKNNAYNRRGMKNLTPIVCFYDTMGCSIEYLK